MKTILNNLLLLILITLVMYSCGNDQVTNNNNTGNPSTSETLRVRHDSIAVYSGTPNSQFNFYFISTTEFHNFHLSFTVDNVDLLPSG